MYKCASLRTLSNEQIEITVVFGFNTCHFSEGVWRVTTNADTSKHHGAVARTSNARMLIRPGSTLL